MAVPGQRKLRLELRLVQLLLDFELEGVARQKTRRCDAVQGCGGRDHHHIGASVLVALLQPPQCGKPFADQVLVRRERVIRQGFPVGEQDAAQVGAKKRHLVDQALCVRRISGDDGKLLALAFFTLAQLRQQQGIG